MKFINKYKYYSAKEILKLNAQYNLVIGERSNGKTYCLLNMALENWIKKRKKTGYIRRWAEDLKGKRGRVIFDGLIANGVISKLTNGEWDRIYYYSKTWYLAKWDEDLKKLVYDTEPFMYGFALSEMEHDKSTSYPDITLIVFDEFMTRGAYYPDEFIQFTNVISTIVRERTDVIIFMLANTVNRYCPYFKEMGLTEVKNQKKGTIDLYKYGESGLRVAVEYADSISKKGKASDVYFAFDNPRLKMITSGTWEIAMYPHLPVKYKPKDILFKFFIIFGDETLQCEIVQKEGIFMFIHEKTTPIKDWDKDFIFTTEYDHRSNVRRRITRARSEIERKIMYLFDREKVFYQDNEVGEVVRNYLQWCQSEKIQ